MDSTRSKRKAKARLYMSQIAELNPSNSDEVILVTKLLGITSASDQGWLVVDVDGTRLAMRFDALSIYWCGDDSVRLPFSR